MKKSLLILLIVVFLAGLGAPLYAQDAALTLESLAEKVEAMVELVTSLSDRMNAFEVRLAALEATDTPTPTLTHTPTPPPTPTATTTPTPTATSTSPTVSISRTMNVRAGPGTNYPVVGQASPGDQYVISGKNPASSWWQIIFDGQYAWVYSPLVTATRGQFVQVASNIPTPAATPVPPAPTATPIPPPPAFPYSLVDSGSCPGNDQQTFFEGLVRDRNNNVLNNVCVHVAFNGPRNTKCTGCGKPTGKWGFSPFGGPASSGTFVEIWVVNCPAGVNTDGSHNSRDFSNLSPLSPKWSMTISNSVGCNNITFKQN